MSCLRDKITEVEEKIALLEYLIKINDGPEISDLDTQLKDATYERYQLGEELLERQLMGDLKDVE